MLKFLICVEIALLAITAAVAGPISLTDGLINSAPVNDLVQDLMVQASHPIISSADRIDYGFSTVTNKTLNIFYPKDEYLCAAQLFDADGKSVPLRMPKVGHGFFDLKFPSADQPWDAVSNMIRVRPMEGTGRSPWEWEFAVQRAITSHNFYTPDELFDISRSGSYKLRLQFQIFTDDVKYSRRSKLKLVRFAPVEVTVIKKQRTPVGIAR